jgi:hypothetical protein
MDKKLSQKDCQAGERTRALLSFRLFPLTMSATVHYLVPISPILILTKSFRTNFLVLH